MPTRLLASLLLLIATGMHPAQAEEAELLPLPVKAPQAVPATPLTEPTATTEKSPVCETTERVCAPAPRIRVVMPPPEVVFRYADGSCSPSNHKGHKGSRCVSTIPVTAPVAAPGGGQLDFNMNFTMPYSMMMGAGAYGGGMPFGYGGFPMMGAGASSGMEALLMRALLGQPREQPNGESDLEARIKRLDNLVNARIEEEMAKMRGAIDQDLKGIMSGVVDLQKRVKDLEKKNP